MVLIVSQDSLERGQEFLPYRDTQDPSTASVLLSHWAEKLDNVQGEPVIT
jgi:hypothetical protein